MGERCLSERFRRAAWQPTNRGSHRAGRGGLAQYSRDTATSPCLAPRPPLPPRCLAPLAGTPPAAARYAASACAGTTSWCPQTQLQSGARRAGVAIAWPGQHQPCQTQAAMLSNSAAMCPLGWASAIAGQAGDTHAVQVQGQMPPPLPTPALAAPPAPPPPAPGSLMSWKRPHCWQKRTVCPSSSMEGIEQCRLQMRYRLRAAKGGTIRGGLLQAGQRQARPQPPEHAGNPITTWHNVRYPLLTCSSCSHSGWVRGRQQGSG